MQSYLLKTSNPAILVRLVHPCLLKPLRVPRAASTDEELSKGLHYVQKLLQRARNTPDTDGVTAGEYLAGERLARGPYVFSLFLSPHVGKLGRNMVGAGLETPAFTF